MDLTLFRYPTLINITAIPDLHHITYRENDFSIGPSVPLTNVMHSLEAKVKGLKSKHVCWPDLRYLILQRVFGVEVLESIIYQLRWFSGPSVRNMATVGGNIVTASPISDLLPVFVCMDAKFVLQSKARGQRTVSARQFVLGYRRTELQSDEVLVDIVVPFNKV